MPIAPIGRLKKSEIVWLHSHRCKHFHTYLEHYQCYLEECPQRERIGFFDIEASNLDADWGIMLCYCIKEAGTDKIYERAITKRELHTCLDKNVVRQCIEDIKRFDRIVGFYSRKYDVPFVRTRAVVHNLPFFNFGEQIHEDLYFNVKYKFKLSRNRMENACRVLLGKTEKTHIDPAKWLAALRGDEKSIRWILDHCRRDVRDLEKLYNRINCFSRRQDTSI